VASSLLTWNRQRYFFKYRFDTDIASIGSMPIPDTDIVLTLEYIVWEISAFKSQFCNVYVHIKMNKVPRKRSNFVLKKSGKPQSDFCTNPGWRLHYCFTLFDMYMFASCRGVGRASNTIAVSNVSVSSRTTSCSL